MSSSEAMTPTATDGSRAGWTVTRAPVPDALDDPAAWAIHAAARISRAVHTGNAGENAHMLAINEALGFHPVGVHALWQRRLTAG